MDNKIIAISNHGTRIGGGEHSFLDLIENLSPAWETTAVFPHAGDLSHWCSNHDIQHRIIDLHRLRPWYLHLNLKSLWSFIQLIRHDRPNLIYANGSRAAFYGSLAGRLCSIPVVWHCRISQQDPYLDHLLGHACDHIIANSQATAGRFGRRYQTKVSVIYNGLNLKWLKDNIVSKPDEILDDWKVILMVARKSKWKRHDLALEAFEKLATDQRDAHLICVGGLDPDDSEWSDYLKRRAENSSFSDRIHWIGMVDDIRPWYRAATVLLLPSDNEPFGRVLIEAMASGLPVIATNGGGVPELIDDGREGFLVEMGNAAEMSRALQTVLNNEDLRQSFSQQALKKADLFQLQAHVQQVDTIFKRMKNKKASSGV